jgi:hypothetical protein
LSNGTKSQLTLESFERDLKANTKALESFFTRFHEIVGDPHQEAICMANMRMIIAGQDLDARRVIEGLKSKMKIGEGTVAEDSVRELLERLIDERMKLERKYGIREKKKKRDEGHKEFTKNEKSLRDLHAKANRLELEKKSSKNPGKIEDSLHKVQTEMIRIKQKVATWQYNYRTASEELFKASNELEKELLNILNNLIKNLPAEVKERLAQKESNTEKFEEEEASEKLKPLPVKSKEVSEWLKKRNTSPVPALLYAVNPYASIFQNDNLPKDLLNLEKYHIISVKSGENQLNATLDDIKSRGFIKFNNIFSFSMGQSKIVIPQNKAVEIQFVKDAFDLTDEIEFGMEIQKNIKTLQYTASNELHYGLCNALISYPGEKLTAMESLLEILPMQEIGTFVGIQYKLALLFDTTDELFLETETFNFGVYRGFGCYIVEIYFYDSMRYEEHFYDTMDQVYALMTEMGLMTQNPPPLPPLEEGQTNPFAPAIKLPPEVPPTPNKEEERPKAPWEDSKGLPKLQLIISLEERTKLLSKKESRDFTKLIIYSLSFIELFKSMKEKDLYDDPITKIIGEIHEFQKYIIGEKNFESKDAYLRAMLRLLSIGSLFLEYFEGDIKPPSNLPETSLFPISLDYEQVENDIDSMSREYPDELPPMQKKSKPKGNKKSNLPEKKKLPHR